MTNRGTLRGRRLALGVLLALLSALAFAVMYVAIRRGVRPGSADDGVMVSVGINALVFTVVISLRAVATSGQVWDWNAFAAFMAAGVCATFLGRTTLFAGIRQLGAARAAAIKNAAPIVTVLLAIVVLGEIPDLLAVSGTVLVMLGVFLIMRESIQTSSTTRNEDGTSTLAIASRTAVEGESISASVERGRRARISSFASSRNVAWGVAISAISALCFGAGHIFRAIGMSIQPDAILGAAAGSWAALLAYVISSSVRQHGPGIVRSVLTANRAFLTAGIASSFGQLCFFTAINYAPISHVAVVASSESVLTVVLVVLLGRQRELLSSRVVLPTLLVFLGSAVIAFARS